VIEVDNKLREKIEKCAPTSEIEAHAIQEGMSMFEVGLRYVVNGMTSMDELIRCVRDGNWG
jgi:type II secretory ATPase GspE/PulE/Tfp pilus assembly ATPase PilB-like protein